MSYKEFTEEDILRRAIQQVLKLDLSRRAGWKEGTGYHKEVPAERLIKNGILTKTEYGHGFYLTESALMRILEVAVDAAVKDLSANPPPIRSIPEIPEWILDEDRAILVYVGEPPEIVIR